MKKHFKELKNLMHLAWPVILTQVGQLFMGLVDTFMLGKVSAQAVGSISIANVFFYSISRY
jgi:MATE family multidrug resistance protein